MFNWNIFQTKFVEEMIDYFSKLNLIDRIIVVIYVYLKLVLKKVLEDGSKIESSNSKTRLNKEIK